LIDKSELSQSQIDQIKQECSTWQNQSLCTQAAFCAEPTYGLGGSYSGGDCRKIADIAANDYAVVQAGLANAGPCADVQLMGGYTATHAEAERDLAETKSAFEAAVASLNWYNQHNTCKSDTASTWLMLSAGTFSGVGLVGAGIREGSMMGLAEGVHQGAFFAAGGGIGGAAFGIPAAQACSG
jgi:hypothetical protein